MIGLKDLRRTGWVLRGVRDPESVADHSWGTALLALLFLEDAEKLDGMIIDRERVLAMSILHDLPEVRTGDIPRRAVPDRQSVSPAQKSKAERTALEEIAGPIAELITLWEEYEAATTAEARYVRDMNLIDMCLQALRYETDRRYDPEIGRSAFPDFERLDEFFATARDRFSTRTGRKIYERIQLRYRANRDQETGKEIS